MKKIIYEAVVLMTAATLLISTPVYATEGMEADIAGEEKLAEDAEMRTLEAEVEEQVMSEEAETCDMDSDPCEVDGCAGDGLEGELIDVTNLPSSEENNCQLTIAADLPDGFDANIFVQMKNYTNGNIYQYTLYAVNKFLQRGYVPEGEYCMIECGLYDDVNGTFPFILPEDFVLKNGEVKAITLTLKDKEMAEKEIGKRLHEGIDEKENKKISNNVFTSSDFDVTFSGTGTGSMAVTGSQRSALKILAKVNKSGLPGDMTVNISYDDGMTFPLTDVKVPYSGIVNLEGTGLKLVFEAPIYEAVGDRSRGHFDEGDTFRSVIHDPKSGVEYSGKYKSRARLELIDEDPDVSIYDQMVKYNIKRIEVDVIKGGGPGEAVVRYSLDGKAFSDEMIVPLSGSWAIGGTTLNINFYVQTGDLVFETGDSYIAEPVAETQNAYISILIAIALLFGAGAFAVWYYFKKQMIPEDIYTIHEYVPVRARTIA